jgi:F-box interacting protein
MDRVSTDVLVDILRRLPHSCRRRGRHVCRRWRDVVNSRITETQGSPKLLLWSIRHAVAYVVDDLSPSSAGSCTELWRTSEPRYYRLIGTCNGLLCLCVEDPKILGGAITLVNPATGETLPIPSMPCAAQFIGWQGWKDWHDADAYSFAYHRTTGLFKVVHVPCRYEQVHDFHAIHVFTLGKATWREVSAGPNGAMCKLAAGVVSIDGMTYWVTITGGAAAKIVMFDLTGDRVISTTTPVPARHDRCRLTEVHGGLGYVMWPDVWVLVEGKRWSHRYKFEQGIPRRHFVYGEYVLTCKGLSFHSHRPKATSTSDQELMRSEVVQIGEHDQGTLVAKMMSTSKRGCLYFYDDDYVTFSYIETMEPLNIYTTNK